MTTCTEIKLKKNQRKVTDLWMVTNLYFPLFRNICYLTDSYVLLFS